MEKTNHRQFTHRKKVWILLSAVTLLIAAILFVPFESDTCQDGGTRVYTALTYKIVVWNRLLAETRETPPYAYNTYTYHNTSVFWFSDSRKSYEELWKIETERNGR